MNSPLHTMNEMVDYRGLSGITLLIACILLCIPFIQLGFQYYLSVMILAFILILFIPSIREIHAATPTLAFILPLMLLPTLLHINLDTGLHSLLRSAREFICLAVIYIFVSQRTAIAERIKLNFKFVKFATALLALSLLAVVIVQYVFLKRGIGYFIPADYYILNAGTIPTELDLLWSRIRPSATFGEPSYLGFVTTSLLFVVLHAFHNHKYKFIIVGVLIFTVVLSNTLAGIIACASILFIYLWMHYNKSHQRLSIMMLSLAAVLVITFSGFLNITERLSNLTDAKVESSGYNRVTVPLKVVSTILIQSPVGVPTHALPAVFRSLHYEAKDFAGGPLSNGFFNIIINYGVFGMIIIYFVIRATHGYLPLVAYLFFSSMFNGGIFTFDKATIIGITILIATYSMRSSSDAARAQGQSRRISNQIDNEKPEPRILKAKQR